MEELTELCDKIKHEIERYQSLPSDTSDAMTIQDIRKQMNHLKYQLDKMDVEWSAKLRMANFQKETKIIKLKQVYKGQISKRPDFLTLHTHKVDEDIMNIQMILSVIKMYQRTLRDEANSCASHIKVLIDQMYNSRNEM
jgi:hypothetical protein